MKTKLVYVYEGITNENGRNELINKKHFGGVYEGGDAIGQLWKEVYEYIEESYDTKKLEKVYINGDGAAWIKSGERFIDKGKMQEVKYTVQYTGRVRSRQGKSLIRYLK